MYSRPGQNTGDSLGCCYIAGVVDGSVTEFSTSNSIRGCGKWWGLEDDGGIYEGAEERRQLPSDLKSRKERAYGSRERIGCLADLDKRTISFYRDGVLLTGAVVKLPAAKDCGDLYPCACPFNSGATVSLVLVPQWDSTWKGGNVDLAAHGETGGLVAKQGDDSAGHSVRTRHPLPASGLVYWEVVFGKLGGSKGDSLGCCYLAGVVSGSGVSAQAFGQRNGLTESEKFWGLEDDGTLYQGDDSGEMPDELKSRSGRGFGVQERLGILAGLDARTLGFFRYGEPLGGPIIKLPGAGDGPLYIAACPFNEGASVQLRLALTVPASAASALIATAWAGEIKMSGMGTSPYRLLILNLVPTDSPEAKQMLLVAGSEMDSSEEEDSDDSDGRGHSDSDEHSGSDSDSRDHSDADLSGSGAGGSDSESDGKGNMVRGDPFSLDLSELGFALGLCECPEIVCNALFAARSGSTQRSRIVPVTKFDSL